MVTAEWVVRAAASPTRPGAWNTASFKKGGGSEN